MGWTGDVQVSWVRVGYFRMATQNEQKVIDDVYAL